MLIFPGAVIPFLVLVGMYIFGMYTSRNAKWVLLSFALGGAAFAVSYFITNELIAVGLDDERIGTVLAPLIQQIVVMFGVYQVVKRENFDNLIDGAVYGFAAGLGYAIADNIVFAMSALNVNVSPEAILLRSFATTLVDATASGIVGVAASQYFFQGRAGRIVKLILGLLSGVVYASIFNLIVLSHFGGDYMPAAYGVAGLTIGGVYVTGQLRRILIQVGVEKRRADTLLNIVIPIGVQLSTERDYARLLENILVEAKRFCKADAGTLYMLKGNFLEFAVLRNDTLRIAGGGTTNEPIFLPPLNLYNIEGKPNHNNIATYVALSGRTANIPDAYDNRDFDFSGTKVFDKLNGYQSISFLTIPLMSRDGTVLGVLQLINALNPKREIVPFDDNLQLLMESFSSLATAALEGYNHEQKLRAEIQQLRIEIDAVKRSKQVDEITSTDYFRNLREKAKSMRESGLSDPGIPRKVDDPDKPDQSTGQSDSEPPDSTENST